MNFFRNPWAIIILVLLVVLLFGAGKLPGLARNVGKSMRIFKSEVEELRGDESGEDEDEVNGDRERRDRRSSQDRDQGARDDRDRQYDPRDQDRDGEQAEPVRAHEDDDSYRRD